MELLGWLWWGVTTLIGVSWSVVWFLLGGWVATLAQLFIVLLVAFAYKYGWQRAPLEMASRGQAFGRFFWAWVRARDLSGPATSAVPPVRRRWSGAATRSSHRRARQIGDVNVSTLMSIAALAGLGLLAVG